jgi:hypothetical protein
MFTKIVSGGQTGVDRAALDVALGLGLPCGGWCPKGRRAEDGPIAPHYPLTETASTAYPHRTRLNVRDSDGTFTLTLGQPDRGTALTIDLARRMKKPLLVVDLDAPADVAAVGAWIRNQRIEVLNVAGPRESTKPGIYAKAARFLRELVGNSGPLPLALGST